MRFKKSLLASAVALSVASLTACNDDNDDNNTDDPNNGPSVSSFTLTNDNVYMLSSGFPGTRIGNGDESLLADSDVDSVTLNIEPGTLILGDEKEALVITRGSKIEAKGTAADPIVMTSFEQFDNWIAGDGTSGRGEWAGLALMGYAKSNECDTTPCNVVAEGGIGRYGGTDDTDNSGTLEYVVVRHAGNEISDNNELNGLTLFATGSGTTMNHIQVHKGDDDGVEHFGGSDFMSHIVLTDNADDSFDWGQGYTGGAQFMIVKQAADDGDRGIEADNDSGAPNAAPISLPMLANMTLIGNPAAAADPVNDSSSDGILLRRGTGAHIYNSIITDFNDACIDIDETATMQRAYDASASDYTGDLFVQNTFTDCATNFETGDQDLDNDATTGDASGKETFAELTPALPLVSEWFAASGTGNVSDTDITLDSTGKPSGAFDVSVTAAGLSGKFEDTAYAGAFDPSAGSQWSEGWTVSLHGNDTVWEPAAAGTLNGAAPSSDGSCPEGTTFVEKITLPDSMGEMDLCQLKSRY